MRCACTDGLGPLGEALAEQAFMVAVCRYTHASTATFGYSLLYSSLNAGGAIAGFIIDLVKTHSILVNGITVTGNRLVLISSLLAALTCVIGGLFVRDGINVVGPASGDDSQHKSRSVNDNNMDGAAWTVERGGEQETDRLTATKLGRDQNTCDAGQDSHSGTLSGVSFNFKPPETNPAVIVVTVARDRNFWRFLFLNLLMIFARLPVKYNNSMLPKFLVRVYGRDVPFGSIVSINWIVCIPLTPLFGEWTRHWHHLDAIRLGTFFTGFATVILVCSVSIPAICLWEVCFTLGECFFAARVQAYAAQLAPTGMEATFMAVAGLPSFLSTFPSGVLSGWLLDSFLPICSDVTDFTNADYCDTKAEVRGYETGGTDVDGKFVELHDAQEMHQMTDIGSGSWHCFSPNVCERGSAPRSGNPCVCDVVERGECNYMCEDLELYGPPSHRSVVTEGVCPTVCAEQMGYSGQPRTLWFVVLCISACGPVLITAFLGVLRTKNMQGGDTFAPVSITQCFRDLVRKIWLALACEGRSSRNRTGAGADYRQGASARGSEYSPVNKSEVDA